MVFTNNEINDDIFAGFFPKKELLYISDYSISEKNDFFLMPDSDAKDLVRAISIEPALSLLLNEGRNMKDAYKSDPDESFDELFFFVNSGYYLKSFSDARFCRLACELCPFVTEIEWLLANILMTGLFLGVESTGIGYCVYLIRFIQKKEIRTGKTVDIEFYKSNPSNLYELVFGDWSETSPYFVVLSMEEADTLKNLDEKREKIDSTIAEEIRSEEEIAKRTEKSWMFFLEMINSFSRIETETVKTVLESDDIVVKKRVLDSYFAMYEKSQNKYSRHGSILGNTEVSSDVQERYEKARRFCCVDAEEKRPFILSPLILNLIERPCSYNSVLLLYHRFRLEHSYNNANAFFGAFTEGLTPNLCFEERENQSIEDICAAFVNCFEDVVKDERVFESLSYDAIQKGWALSTLGETSLPRVFQLDIQRILNDSISLKIPQAEKTVEKEGVSGFVGTLFETEAGERFKNTLVKEYSAGMDEELLERIVQIKLLIHYLDWLYLCCDAIKIILLDHPKEKYYIGAPHSLEEMRSKLLDYDDIVVRKVYGSKARKVRELREKTGINSDLISERERNNHVQSNELQLQLVVEVFSNYINDALEVMNQSSEEEIQLNRNKIIQRELSYLPIDVPFDVIENKLEQLSRSISAKLVQSRKDGDDFQTTRAALIEFFADSATLIPENALDTFVTAELLYNKYARASYATHGFDYSSISALYYQAFETLYNELLWRPYANEVNVLVLDGRRLVEQIGVLWKLRDYLPEEEKKEYRRVERIAEKYFNPAKKERNNYIEKKGDLYMVRPYCTYMNFAIMLNDSVKAIKYPKYAEFLAASFGYQSSIDMRKDSRFIFRLSKFAEEIKSAAVDRNNASHGGELIPLEQCTKDKCRVLNKVANERNVSLGLALQLLDLFAGRY